MPYKEHIIEKKYFTIGEVAKMFGLPTSCLRFWEAEFSDQFILREKINRRYQRLFKKKDIDKVKLIVYLTKDMGLTLPAVKDYLKDPEGYVEKLKELPKLLPQ